MVWGKAEWSGVEWSGVVEWSILTEYRKFSKQINLISLVNAMNLL